MRMIPHDLGVEVFDYSRICLELGLHRKVSVKRVLVFVALYYRLAMILQLQKLLLVTIQSQMLFKNNYNLSSILDEQKKQRQMKKYEQLLKKQQLEQSKKKWDQVCTTIKFGEEEGSRNKIIRDIRVLAIVNHSPNIWKLIDLSPSLSLQEVWLNKNQILTLEPIVEMLFPNLKKFSVSYNNIVSLKPFRRIFIPKIVQLQFDDNLILQPYFLSQLYCNFKQLSIWIYYDEKSIQKVKVEKILKTKMSSQNFKIQ